jgi:2-hydroxy-4-carboxymuconate semialdehyde hemiacetal dehydrogenase
MVNLCMVGSGGIAAEHMKAFKVIGGVHPRWIVSRRQEKAWEFAQEWSFDQAGTDLEAALADPTVDLVVVASPNEQHTPQVIRSLQAGKDVIVEIPVGLSLANAQQVAKLAGDLRRRVLVCHTMRSFPAIREVRRRVLAGEFHITHVVGYFAIPRRRNQSWAGTRNWMDNLLWHHGCHVVDAALWILGVNHAEHVSGMLGKSHRQFGMAMDVSIHFRTSANQLVTHALTYNTEQFCWELRCIGDEDTLTFRNGQLLNEKNEQIVSETSWLDLVPQDKQMLATLTKGAPSDYDVSSVLGPMEILQCAEASSQQLTANATESIHP